MKQFFGAFFGSIIGIVLATVVAVSILIFAVKSSFKGALKEESATLKANSVLRLDLEGTIQDRKPDNQLAGFRGVRPILDHNPGLNTIGKKLEAAKTDDKIKGLYLYIRPLSTGFATLLEMRNMIADFKKSGKFVYAYAENFSTGEYFIASVADKVFMNPEGSFDWRGLSMGLVFFAKTVEKLDLDLQVFRHGRFKSAVEPFILEKMSAANREQSEIFLNSIWNSVLTKIAEDRQLDAAMLNSMADQLAIRIPSDAVGKFVDALAYEDQVYAELTEKSGLKNANKPEFVEFGKYTGTAKKDIKAGAARIAVIYAGGVISEKDDADDGISGMQMSRTIREARLDDKVKAIVIRVNSPGGSALASEVIWREVNLARAVKPTVVSMGNLAASGGYYISCAADRIFAQPNTITGSIGVFGLLPSFGRMLESKFGITGDTVNTNKHSDMALLMRKLTEAERDYVQNNVERIYTVFTQHVADGRKMSAANVDSIGQGRVWSGADALKLGLVDELGGLDAAIAYAAKKADLKDYRLIEMPKQKGIFDELLSMGGTQAPSQLMEKELGPLYGHYSNIKSLLSVTGIQARLPFELVIR